MIKSFTKNMSSSAKGEFDSRLGRYQLVLIITWMGDGLYEDR